MGCSVLRALVTMLLLVFLLSSNLDTSNARNSHLKSRRESGSPTKKGSSQHNQHHGGSHSDKPGPSPEPKPSPSSKPHQKTKPPSDPTPSPSSKPHQKMKPPPDPTPSPSSKPHQKTKPPPDPTPSPSSKPHQKPKPQPSPRSKPHRKMKPQPSPTPSPEPTPSPSSKPHRKPKPQQPSPSPSPSPSPRPKPRPQPSPSKDIFNVLDFGAEGDGKSDDTKAFESAWAEACKVKGSTVLVPSDSVFLVAPISFNGDNCQPNIVFQLDGAIVAPRSPKAWGSGSMQWLEFTKLSGFTIQGNGNIDGQGEVWWSGGMPHTKPTAVRFYGSTGVTVTGITIQNSQKFHLKFDNCNGVEVYSITISSPGDSPNTDGIHLQNSQNVVIHHCDLSCGDDCVSIQTGCSNVNIHNVNCGPGHGISIGGLGPDNTKACVSDVTVENVALKGTMTGVRIKTWQGGSGSVRNIRFSNIDVTEVKIPIMIDQYYCDRSSCKNQSRAVAVSGVLFENIRGTYTSKPVHLACSESTPCMDISLSGIELEPSKGSNHVNPFCWHTYGQLEPPMVPPIDCLQIGKPPKNQISDSC